jgi:hypothetical protein
MKILSILVGLILTSSVTANANSAAVEVLSGSGLIRATASIKTIYANKGDDIFYKEVSASKGMLLLTDDGVIKYKPGIGNRVVVAVVKNYS